MDDVINVEITDRLHAAEVNQFLGLATAAEALAKTPDFQRVPGFALASALIDRCLADQRAAVVHLHLKAVAAAGIDITKTQSINLSFNKERIRLEVKMMDLADMGLSNG